MFKWFGKIFGSEKVIDAGIKGIDAIWFTNEEKAEAHKEFLKLYEPYKLAQRLIALIITIPYVLCVLILFGMYIAGLEVVPAVDFLNELLGIPFMMIIAFYYAGSLPIPKMKK